MATTTNYDLELQACDVTQFNSSAQGEENAVASKMGLACGYGNIVSRGGTVYEVAQASGNTIVLKADAPADLAGKQVLISCFGLLEGALAKTVDP